MAKKKKVKLVSDDEILFPKMNWGGKRVNSGKKHKFGEPTSTVSFRVPNSKIIEFKEHISKLLTQWVKI